MNEAHGHYAYEIHGAAEEHHRHYDTESELRELRSLVAACAKTSAALRIASAAWRAIHRRPGSSSWRPTSPRPISPSPATTAGRRKAPAGMVPAAGARSATTLSRTTTTPGQRPTSTGSLRHDRPTSAVRRRIPAACHRPSHPSRQRRDRKSTRLNSSHVEISYA